MQNTLNLKNSFLLNPKDNYYIIVIFQIKSYHLNFQIFKNISEIKEILINEKADSNKLEQLLQKFIEDLSKNNNYISLETNLLRDFLESFANWILKNFSSSKLNSVLGFLIIFFKKLNYKVEIQKDGKKI